MEYKDYSSFRKKCINAADNKFWHQLRNGKNSLFMIFMFNFCSLNSDVRTDKFGQLYLCYNYKEGKSPENNLLLKQIFQKKFPENSNEKYIGFYKLERNEDCREVLLALFILGNEIKDEKLKTYLLKGNVGIHFEKFQKTGFSADELLDQYITEIVKEFEAVALQVRKTIFDNEVLAANSADLSIFPFLKAYEN